MELLDKIIRLNFWPLGEQEFSFKVWRKKYAQEKKENISQNISLNTLPIKGDLNARDTYWISFEPRDSFEEYSCQQNYNYKLTERYLFHLLVQKAKSTLKAESYILPEKEFRKVLFFVLEDYPEGKETVWLEPYHLQFGANGKFGFLADFKFRKNEDIPYSRAVQQLSLSLDRNFRSNRNFYIDKYQKLQEFLHRFGSTIFPLSSGAQEIDISNKLQELPTQSLRTKSYIFGTGESDISQYRGLANYGPLDEIQKDVVLAFVFREKDSYLADDLMRALRGEYHDVAFKGMQPLFNLRIGRVEKIPIADFSKKELNRAIEKIRSMRNAPEPLLMPIIIGDKTDDETYYYMKYKLLKENQPIQVVTYQLLGKRDSLKWSVSNIALQIFAKLGGKPWKVLPSHEKSIIFGIGQAHQISNGEITKFFAYSVCTDSSGLYKKISILGKSDDKNTYLRQLRKNIIDTIEEHIEEGYTKYVLHIPFKIRRIELDQINEAIEELVNSRDMSGFDFVVLRVYTKNKYFGYAYTNSLVPYESTFTVLSNTPKSYLVWSEGLQYHRETIHKRVGGPIYIEFYWTNKDIDENERIKYLQDILNLSGANWRGFNAKSLPISIYYCQLIASMVNRFPEEVENIDHIANPWFL